MDFHALRVTFITLIIEAGANIKEAQELARHSTPEMTLNIYARTNKKKLAEVIKTVGENLEVTPTGTPPVEKLSVSH